MDLVVRIPGSSPAVGSGRVRKARQSIHVAFDESNDSLQGRENVDDDVGLDFSMGRLQIEDKIHQQEEELNKKRKNNHLGLFLHLLNLNKENQVKDFQESGNSPQTI